MKKGSSEKDYKKWIDVRNILWFLLLPPWALSIFGVLLIYQDPELTDSFIGHGIIFSYFSYPIFLFLAYALSSLFWKSKKFQKARAASYLPLLSIVPSIYFMISYFEGCSVLPCGL